MILPHTKSRRQRRRDRFAGIRRCGHHREVPMKCCTFIIETKNMNGTIVGNYDAQYWTQRKIGRNGTPYSGQLYSPVKQVKTHVYRLANYLRKENINVFVDAMVYFSNPNSVVQVTGFSAGTPVFSALGNGSEEICHQILCSDQKLSPEVLAKVNTLLEALAAKES